MVLRVAINGFGRIGRTILKIGLKEKHLKFVAINDLTDPKTLSYLFQHDTAYGKFEEKVKLSKGHIDIGKNKIKLLSETDPANLPWKEMKVDLVIESTGIFRTYEQASMHLDAGAKRVIITAPPKGKTPVKTIVYGVNHKTIKKTDKILSNASCTTNCLAPLIKIIDDKFGITHGFMTAIHAYTAGQNLVDAPNKDLRRGRAAAMNIVPTTTGAADAIISVIPKIGHRLNGIAIRVPVIDVSLTDLNLHLKKKVTKNQINKAFEKASKKELKGILDYSKEELVSSDIIKNPFACVFDSKFTRVIDPQTKSEKAKGNMVKILGWYDNEYGYCTQLIKLTRKL